MELVNIYNRPLNRWDKDSIRPGPVGSVGDTLTGVKLKKSAIDLPDRYDSVWSGKNEVWSGSNVSDGMHVGFTSGGRSAAVIQQGYNRYLGFKTNVGWIHEDLRPTDRSTNSTMTPLGQYDWQNKVATVYKAKITGQQFLPLPGGYSADVLKAEGTIPRGSQVPQIIAQSVGNGTTLPAADVNITDPEFGDTGKIEEPGNPANCPQAFPDKYWIPLPNDPLRNMTDKEVLRWKAQNGYHIAKAWYHNAKVYYDEHKFPDAGDEIAVYAGREYFHIPGDKLSTCGMMERPAERPIQMGPEGPIYRPLPGNQQKRKYEEDQKKKENQKGLIRG